MKNLLLLLCILCTSSMLLAQHSITGKVLDGNGEVLIGVSVYERGSTGGTITEVDGTYALTVSSDQATIVFSYTGYEEKEVTLAGQSVLDVTMNQGVTLVEIQVVGSRNYGRTSTDSPVAIDVIDVGELAAVSGKVEINQILQYAAPSFNATKQSGSDGADHIDPASLRGLGPDQTLVLINGKRRHQSSLVNIFGTRGRGNTGTDLNAIPASAIKRIEVLRDGASAQYGSDAIAGVINIVLKDQTDGLTGSVSYGAYSTAVGEGYAEESGETLYNVEGKDRLDGEERSFDGNTTKIDLNYGGALGKEGGFFNVTAEYLTKQRTLRPGFSWRKGYGSAAVDQFQFMVNAAMPISDNTEIYAFGGRTDRDTDAYAFSRSAPGAEADGGDPRTVASLYPDGFTPHITSRIADNAVTAGVRHDLKSGWKGDVSHTFGLNKFHYFITGTNNASLGAASPTDFDAGGHSLAMNVTSVDFSKYYTNIASGLNVAFGTEYRTENFKIFAGEESSYSIYDTNGLVITNPATQTPFVNEFGDETPGGSQGFPGYSPANEVDRTRSNIGFYGDVELNATDALLIGTALRLENYSDFGSTFNYKLAARYKIVEGLALRASASSGFRAPSLAQIHYNLLFNNIVAGESLRTLLAANTSTVAKAFGIESLKEEKAQNYAMGIAYKKGGFSASLDGYIINVQDRIILTDIFDASNLGVGADGAQFFANGVDTKTSGLDLVLNYKHFLDTEGEKSIYGGIAANFNNTEIKSINSGDLNEFIFFGPFSQGYLEAAAPDFKIGFNVGCKIGEFSALLNWTQFSEVTLQDFQWVDSPATTQEDADALYEVASDVYKTKGVLDLSLSYDISKKFSVTLGANNLLNTYPTPQFDGWTDQGSFNDSVQMGSDGMYLFGRFGFSF